MVSIRHLLLGDSAVILARDDVEAVRGFLHYVPGDGRFPMTVRRAVSAR